MGAAVLVYEYFSRSNDYSSGETDVWIESPTKQGILLYSVITPVICLFGICGNTLSLMVLKRDELRASVYTYLTVLAFMDLCNSITLFISGLSRGILWYTFGWAAFDAVILLPISGFFTTLSVMATVLVTLDRVLYLWHPAHCKKPDFCNRKVARKVMVASAVIAALFNSPYCFIYKWSDEEEKEDKSLTTTDFFDSTLYFIHNWIRFILFAVFPAIFLILGNGFLILSIRKAWRLKAKCSTTRKKDHTHLTITLVAIVFFFLIGEIPTHLVSRKTALTLLFEGDYEKANCSRTLETIRQLTTVLSAINLSVNFVLYCLFCPAFCRALRAMLSNGQERKRRQTLQVNVFVVNGDYAEKKKSFSIENFGGNARVLNELLVSSDDAGKPERFPSSLGNEESERVNCEDDWQSYSEKTLNK